MGSDPMPGDDGVGPARARRSSSVSRVERRQQLAATVACLLRWHAAEADMHSAVLDFWDLRERIKRLVGQPFDRKRSANPPRLKTAARQRLAPPLRQQQLLNPLVRQSQRSPGRRA